MGKSAEGEIQVTEYSMAMHVALCTEVDKVTEIWIGEKLAWINLETGLVTNARIDYPSLFGGIKKEGGVKGYATLFRGSLTQTMGDFARFFGLTSETCPGFRGFASLFFWGVMPPETPTWTPIPGSATGSGGGEGGGTGGGWSEPGGSCPAPWVLVTLANDALDGPGDTVFAGGLRAGDRVWTMHESALTWGAFEISAVSFDTAERWQVIVDDGREIVASQGHRFRCESEWVAIENLTAGTTILGEHEGVVRSVGHIDRGDVVKITVAEAASYLTAGLLSHNVKQIGGNTDLIDLPVFVP